MQESLLHHLWGLQYFDKTDLRTTQGELVNLFDPGVLNSDAGPDFSNARLSIGPIHWVGNVEIHVHSSGWLDHRHDVDPAYDSVILHVVWQEDKCIVRSDGTPIPTLELRGRVNEQLILDYRQLISSSFSIPCKKTFPQLDEVLKVAMVTKALVHRLERKSEEVQSILKLNGNSWEETTYQLLARAYGLKINNDPFFQLARTIPQRIIQKLHQLVQIEALMFGQAGFLEAPKGDDYYLSLRREYNLLAHKHSLRNGRMSKSQWRFLRLRPPNFPTLRLAQFSALIFNRKALFSAILELQTINDLINFFSVSTSEYWHDHYQFSKIAANRGHELGRGSIDVIIINAVVPLLAAYAQRMDDQKFMDRALLLLEQLPAEENRITQRWADLGLPARNSFDAQGQIELFNTFCQRKRCLQCTIGTAIIRPPDNEPVYPLA